MHSHSLKFSSFKGLAKKRSNFVDTGGNKHDDLKMIKIIIVKNSLFYAINFYRNNEPR